MRQSFALALLFTIAAFQAAPILAADQVIEPLDNGVEQQIEVLTTDDQMQRVEIIHGNVEQDVAGHVPPTPTQKTASKVGKFMLGVASAGVALGVMAASLLLL